MNALRSAPRPLGWIPAFLLILTGAACFYAAYLPGRLGPVHLLIVGYLICLVQLARLKTVRRSFYAGLATGILCIAPQLACFVKIFGPAAVVLWVILAFWIGAFTGIVQASLSRFGVVWTSMLIPVVWMGLEYFRSELYYLKFSWLNVGYAFSDWRVFPYHLLGMYGVGFLCAVCAALFLVFHWRYAALLACFLIFATAIFSLALKPPNGNSQVRIAGVQMEFPSETDIPAALDSLIHKYPNADVLVLSEYTLDDTVPENLKSWCRKNQRYLIVGGKDPAPKNNFYDTAFVVGTNGDIVFRQGKSVPIQFFKDGLPAPEQHVWNSPWGKIGFCVCYDLSYTRVIDRLVKKGAQMLIVPTMDVVDWGEKEHQLHSLVAPIRSEEYGIPIFRLASSGISQATDVRGRQLASAPFPGQNADMFATIDLPSNTSLPLDRYFAPVAAGAVGVLLIGLNIHRPKMSGTQNSRDGDKKKNKEQDYSANPA